MFPCVSVGWGSRLHLINGGRQTPSNLTFTPITTDNDPLSVWNPDSSPGGASDYEEALYGGKSSVWPASFCNHNPGAFYYGKFYWTQNRISLNGGIYFLRWDGSGIYKNPGFINGNGYDANWRNGRGTELISPSGTVTEIACNSLSAIVHNGVLFFVGENHISSINALTSDWNNKLGWDVFEDGDGNTGDDSQDKLRTRRAYRSFAIIKDSINGPEKKIMGPRVKFNAGTSGLAPSREDTHSCHAISWKDDILYANHIDIINFPGGSGSPVVVESNLNFPSSKHFAIFPTSGFNSSGDKVGNDKLLLLTGSGVLKSINFPSGISQPSGTTTMIDLGNLVLDADLNKSVRTKSIMARREDTTSEPQRSCVLKPFSNKLHAFFVSATSGYHHLVCNGDPTNSDNWENRTLRMPEDFRRFDGDMYCYHDTFRNTLNCLHVAKGDVGMWGSVGLGRGAGGHSLYELNTDFDWNEIYIGGSAEPSIGIIPYNNFGVYATAPSGGNPQIIPSTDYALIEYKLHSPFNRVVNVTFEYSIDEGLTWSSARRFRSYIDGTPQGSGLQNLNSSFHGNNYTFFWDYVNDVGFNNIQDILIRIRPKVVR